MAQAKKPHYVDNKQLYAVMIEYKKAVDLAEDQGDTKPQIPDYVGRCLLQIANRLATKPNFANYTFCLLYTSPSPRDSALSRMPSSA